MKHRTPKVAVVDIKYLMPKYQISMRVKDIKVDFRKLEQLKKDKVTEINIVACHSDAVSVNRINNYVTEAFNDLPQHLNFIIKITFVLIKGRNVARAMAADIIKQRIEKLTEDGVATKTYELPPHAYHYRRVKSKSIKPTPTKAVSLGIIPFI
mgnify:CR=1 FL=1|jgi:hypothetical protein